MISVQGAKSKCKDDISKIENYDKAVADKEHLWVCHHRLEFTLEGEFAHTSKELERLGMYYKRPYFELIFLNPSEHRELHSNTKEHKQKMSEVRKEKPYCEFGIKFKEYYGVSPRQNINLYEKERRWYKRHNNKCRWED